MSGYFNERFYYFYNGHQVRYRKQSINLINIIKLFVLKILMATTFCSAMMASSSRDFFNLGSASTSVSAVLVLLGCFFLFLVNRKLIMMRI
jgi:hypothetical protein